MSDKIFAPLSFDAAPVVKTPPPGPLSREYLDFQASHEGSAVSYPKGLPMALRRGRGATVEDVDGNIYIDFFGGAGVMNVGHSNPEVVEAAMRQITELTHALDIPHPNHKALVEALLPLLPKELTRVFFSGPTGSDAIESAVKLAKYNTKRVPFVAFEGSYHGMTTAALSLTSGASFKEEFLPLLPEIHFIPYAYCYRCAFNMKPEACDLFCARYLDHKLSDPHSGISRPAAVIVEAVQGEGGSVVPPDGFLPIIREICDRHEVLLFNDEFMGTTSVHDFDTGTLAAAFGGTTTVIDFSNQKPEDRSLLETIGRKKEEARGRAVVDWAVHPVVTRADQRTLDEIRLAAGQGAPTVKCYMTYRSEGLMMDDVGLKAVMTRLRGANSMLLVHA